MAGNLKNPFFEDWSKEYDDRRNKSSSFGQVIKSQIIKKQFDYSISNTSPIILIEKWNELTSLIVILMLFTIINSFLESTLIIIIGSVIALLLFGAMRNQSLVVFFKKIIGIPSIGHTKNTFETFYK
jgi:hypothetical protein